MEERERERERVEGDETETRVGQGSEFEKLSTYFMVMFLADLMELFDVVESSDVCVCAVLCSVV